MRFEELVFERVGMWTDLPPLRMGPKLTLVLGDNEAGKSTSMRAIDALLFGADANLVAPLPSITDFRASARVRLMDGTELGWKRQGRKVEPAELAERLAALAPPEQRPTFQALFRLGHESVRADPEFLAEDGALGRVLFAAESGASAASLGDLEKSLQDLEKKAESSSKAGNGLKKIVGEFKDLRSTQRAGFDDYERTGDELRQVNAQLDALREEMGQAREGQARLRALKEGLSHARERQSAIEQLAVLEEAGHLASREQAQAIREAARKLDEAVEEEKKRAQKLEQAGDALNALPPVPPIADFAAEVDELDRKVAGIEKDSKSLEEARAALADARRELRTLLASAFDLSAPDETLLAQARQLLVSQAARRAFKELLAQGEKARSELESARRTMEDAASKSAQARAEAEAGAELPTTALAQALELVREIRVLDERIESLENQRNETANKARAATRTLGLAKLDEADIARLALPSRARLDDAYVRLDQARQDAKAAASKLDDARAKQQKASEQEQALLEALQEAVTDEAFDAARRARDEAWRQVKTTWTPAWRTGAELDLPALGAAYEGLVIEVDQLADRRFRNANQLGQLAKAKEAHEAARREVEQATSRVAAATEEVARAQADWQAQWAFLEDAPESHVEWLGEHKRLIDHLDAVDQASAELARLRQKRQALRADVGCLLTEELPDATSLDTAAALQQAVQTELDRRKTHNDEAARRKSERETQEKNARDAADRHDRMWREVEAWNERWHQQSAGLPAHVPAETTAVELWLSQQDRLAQLCRDLENHGEIIARKTADLEAFEARVKALLDDVRERDPALAVPASLSPLAALRELSRLARDATAAREQYQRVEQALDHARAEASSAQETVQRHRQALTDRWAEGGFEVEWTAELIDDETKRAEEAHALREQIKQCEATLRPLWKTTLEVALSEIDGRSEDDLAADAGREAERIVSLEETREACIRRKAELEQARQALETEGAEETAQALALVSDRLLDKANELATLKAALWLLGKARQKATDSAAPLVELASKNFAQLTGGEYAGLEIDRDGQLPTLRAIPAHGDSKKAEELSDGTLDQLWLALRLAVVQQAAKKTPWPLVLDDVFVHFDDQRTTQALKLLATLSEQMQVIVFTHHDHVVDLARAAVPEALEVVVLARAEHRERVLPEGRERHERPEAPAAHLPDTRPATAGSLDAYGHILQVLETATAPMGKAEILEAVEQTFGVSVEREWNKTINQLVADARVVKEGEKRGAKYSLAQSDETSATG